MEKRHNKNKLSPTKKLFIIGSIVFASIFLNSCEANSKETPSTSATSVIMDRTISVETVTNGVYRGVPFEISRDVNGYLSQISGTNIEQDVCQADPQFKEESSIDIRKAVCDEYDKIARKMGISEEEIPFFVLKLASKTVVVAPSQSISVCDNPNADCYNSDVGKIFVSAQRLNSLSHEKDHYAAGLIPDGTRLYDFIEGQPVCYKKINGLFEVYYLDRNTNVYAKHIFSNELDESINDIAFQDYSNYAPSTTPIYDQIKPYAQIISTNPEANLTYNITMSTDTFRSPNVASLSDFSEALRYLTTVSGLEGLIGLDNEFQIATGLSIFQDPSPQISPVEACAQ